MKRVTWLITISSVLLFAFDGLAANGKSAKLVAEAWQAWETNDHALVESRFREAIDEDKTNTRAYLGLSYLYLLQEKTSDSWAAWRHILETAEDPTPYIFAAWLSPIFKPDMSNDEEVVELLEKLARQRDPTGTIRAQAHSELGKYYQTRNELSKANAHFASVGDIKDWVIIGPFENISATGFDNVYAPENEFVVDKTYEGKNGIPANWIKVPSFDNYLWLNFLYYYAHENAMYYANAFVRSPVEQAVQLRVGTSGSLKAFVNDDLVIAHFDENNNDLDTYISEVTLQKGWNRLLIKCGYSEIDRCNFLARVTDARGEAIDGLEYSVETQPYPARPGAPLRVLENFAESFFQDRIAENPDHLENYILLADTYLRNDKAVEAELVINEALERSPNCAVLYRYLIEAFLRGEKFDEMDTAFERVYSLDKNFPLVLRYKLQSSLETEEYDKAEALLEALEALTPGSADVDQLTIDLYMAKDLMDQAFAKVHEAYAAHPSSWLFATYEAYLSVQTTLEHDGAVEIYQKYLEHNYDAVGLVALADVYLQLPDVDKWRETRDKMFELDPAPVSYYYQIADVYFNLQDYAKARETLEKAIEIVPNNSMYWQKLGDILRMERETDGAKQAYRSALKYSPSNYDARDVLRELEGRKPVYDQFESVDIDSLIANAPSDDDYPDNEAVYLLYDVKRVVYEKGASESLVEKVIKVLNKDGISQFGEKWVPYNYYTETLTIEKAVVVKPNGSEIRADINDNHLVFKTLEENDIIHVKWKVRNYYSGKLSRHFWDSFYLNRFYPMQNVRYSLLVPDDFVFEYRVQNIDLEPTKRASDEGTVYQWALTDEPAVEFEYGMLGLGDVGKVLHISSIPDWRYISEWYTDLAQTKTRSSYEIRDTVKDLFAGRDDLETEEKVAIVYGFITENINYSSVPFRQSPHIPQKARDVLVTKTGDCKDVSTLAIAMLGEVDVDAHFVLMNTKDEGLNRFALPSIAFNHCVTQVDTESGPKYYDFTGHNYPPGVFPEPEIEAFSLPIRSGVTEPSYLARDLLPKTEVYRTCRVEIGEDNGITVASRSRRSGALGAMMRSAFRFTSDKERVKNLTESLSSDYPNIKVTHLEVENLDNLENELTLIYAFEAPGYVAESGQFRFLKIPWEAEYESHAALSYDEREHAYDFSPGLDKLTEEIEIHLPEGLEPVDLAGEVAFTSKIADYAIRYTFADRVLNIHKTLTIKQTLVQPEDYVEFKEFYNNFVREDAKQILLKKS